MVTNLRKERAPIELGAVALEGRTRAFLKVQEGCDQFCSFCIVPTSRGTSRSVEPRRVFDALDELAASGFREVILTGVHLGGYGRRPRSAGRPRDSAGDGRRALADRPGAG